MLREIKGLQSDCSTVPDNIPAKFVKLVAEHLVSLLTHIINSRLDRNKYPLLWKTTRISPIPKVDEPRTNDDCRPISILPVWCKVYEKLALRQITDFLTENATLQSNISSYRKCHSTTTTKLAIRDDILKAMKRSEITLAVIANLSKAFDTVAFEKVLYKLHLMGFSRTALQWRASYLTSRKQFVQVDDRSSAQISNLIRLLTVIHGTTLGCNYILNHNSRIMRKENELSVCFLFHSQNCHDNPDTEQFYTFLSYQHDLFKACPELYIVYNIA